ncbi:MAG: IS1 family transposase [Chloroflexi bacterium]|nr:IS1 family transposase [Chloroflexota bacterium]
MNPQDVFCPNLNCPASGQRGQGNIGIHSQKQRRYRCGVCGQTFSERKGTAFYGLHSPAELVTLVITLLAYGCPLQAIVIAFHLDERTVRNWQARAGQQCERVHQHLVQQPRDLGQVQLDELRVKKQGGIVWLACALQVRTRLWLGGALSAQHDLPLIVHLVQQVRACALCRTLLFCTDGFRAYVSAIQQVFREAIPTGKPGRPAWRPWDGILIAQVVKQYAQHHVVGVLRRVVQGTTVQVEAMLQQTQPTTTINTAYIERLNATFRSRLSGLIRRGRALARQTVSLQHGLYLIGSVYNFCAYHKSLRLSGIINGHQWIPRTPAIAAGITDHRWSVHELLSFQVPPKRWTPPKQPGRPSAETKRLVARWCT